jgi:hypothetical protein
MLGVVRKAHSTGFKAFFNSCEDVPGVCVKAHGIWQLFCGQPQIPD